MFFSGFVALRSTKWRTHSTSSASGTITNEPVRLSERAEKKRGFFFFLTRIRSMANNLNRLDERIYEPMEEPL